MTLAAADLILSIFNLNKIGKDTWKRKITELVSLSPLKHFKVMV